MKTKFLIVQTLILFVMIGSCYSQPDLKLEEQKIKKLYSDLCTYAVSGNWTEYSKLMKNDSTLQIIHPDNGNWLRGYQDFAKQYEPLIRKGINAEFITKDMKIFFSKNADVAWGTIDVVTRIISSSNSIEFSTWNVFVVEKIDNEWKWALINQSKPKNNENITTR